MNKAILPLLLVSAVALSGCGKKKDEQPASTPATPPAAEQPATPGVKDQAKQVVADVTAQATAAAEQAKQQALEAAEQAKQQAADAAKQAEEQAKAAVADAAAKAQAELAALSTKAVESAKNLLNNPGVTEPVKAELNKLITGVTSGNDTESTSALNKIVALKPSEEQMALVKEVQSNLGVLVLGRNFDANDPASGGAVKQTIEAIKAKDTGAIVSNLKNMASNAKFTDSQKEMLTNLMGSYSGKLAGAVDSVNKATQTLKGFGF